MNFETENIEFKFGFTEEIYKKVIAFANTDGGVLYIGIPRHIALDFKAFCQSSF